MDFRGTRVTMWAEFIQLRWESGGSFLSTRY